MSLISKTPIYRAMRYGASYIDFPLSRDEAFLFLEGLGIPSAVFEIGWGGRLRDRPNQVEQKS